MIPVNEEPPETPQSPSEEADVSRRAAEPRHRIRLPRFIVHEGVGLGDAIKRGTTGLGVRPCGSCEERAARLNRWVGFGPRR